MGACASGQVPPRGGPPPFERPPIAPPPFVPGTAFETEAAAPPPAAPAAAESHAKTAPPEEPPKRSGPRIGALSAFAYIYKHPSFEGLALGSIRMGTSVALRSAQRVEGKGCKRGWYAV